MFRRHEHRRGHGLGNIAGANVLHHGDERVNHRSIKRFARTGMHDVDQLREETGSNGWMVDPERHGKCCGLDSERDLSSGLLYADVRRTQ